MQRKLKLTWWFVYEWWKPLRQEPRWVILWSPLPRIYYYHNKRLQVKESQYLIPTLRTYVIQLLGTYVTILCNWLNLWQNAFYLYLVRSRMCLILQETLFQDQVLKSCKSNQETSWKVPIIKARQLAQQLSYLSSLKSCSASWLDNSSTDRVSVEVYKKQIFSSVLTQIRVYVFEPSFLTTLDI